MAPRKRAVPLVQLVANAAGRLPPNRIELTMIGGGPSLGRVRSAVADLGMERQVELCGRLERAEVHARYAGADVFLAPADLEAFGIAALEARAAGLVVIGRVDTGLAEFIEDGVDGLMVADDAAMSDAIVRLAREPALLARLKEHNRTVEPAFAWDDVLAGARTQYDRAVRILAEQ